MIESKDAESRKLKEKIDEMSSDFAEMLKETLRKMQERVDFANQTWDNDKMDEGMGAGSQQFDDQ